MRWLLLDQILTVEKGHLARTLSRIPEKSYSPEILMIEMMAQTGALLLGAESDFKKDLVLSKIEALEFFPGWNLGETIWIEASSESLRPEGAWLEAVIRNEKTQVAKGRLLLLHVDPLVPGQEEPVTFHQEFMEHFQVREKVSK